MAKNRQAETPDLHIGEYMKLRKLLTVISILTVGFINACGARTNARSVETPPHLTLEILQNAEYQTLNYPQKFKLSHGIYFQPPPVKAESQEDWFTKLADPVMFGDLNNDGLEDAAVILRSRAGGTGVEVDLAAVINDSGTPDNVSTLYLGDRVQVKSGIIQSSIITLDLLVQGPNDGLCCPTLPVTRHWKLVNHNLVQTP